MVGRRDPGLHPLEATLRPQVESRLTYGSTVSEMFVSVFRHEQPFATQLRSRCCASNRPRVKCGRRQRAHVSRLLRTGTQAADPLRRSVRRLLGSAPGDLRYVTNGERTICGRTKGIITGAGRNTFASVAATAGGAKAVEGPVLHPEGKMSDGMKFSVHFSTHHTDNGLGVTIIDVTKGCD